MNAIQNRVLPAGIKVSVKVAPLSVPLFSLLTSVSSACRASFYLCLFIEMDLFIFTIDKTSVSAINRIYVYI